VARQLHRTDSGNFYASMSKVMVSVIPNSSVAPKDQYLTLVSVVVGATSAVIPNVDCGDDSGSELASANRSLIVIASYGGGFFGVLSTI
jgi:hypothetical protein